ncbi:TetR family transcriptional regulator [Sinobaca qinghaiensis]|uniref:TetR family transcriptional regulator n=1 Tax=Sinobaca qinghaiensis TaxID=342944 RepID=A0A419UU69_9BACL|nr:TetR/AcrR family transcriptional regulator [Sinobaca qinghaiensis]RKD68142.1 TetR family transcriptional regulator [Sinobaca qinghaiensis]
MSPKLGMEMIRREQIIQSAKTCILTYGFDHFSIKDVAKTADLSTGVIYHYFKNKNDLLVDVLKEAFAVSEEDVRNTVDAYHHPVEKFHAYLRTVASLPDHNQPFYTILLNYMAQSPYNEKINEVVGRFLRNLVLYLTTILEEAEQQNLLHHSSPSALALLIINQATGAAFNERYFSAEVVKANRNAFIQLFQSMVATPASS